ncbi:AmmeMemoRadiSam system protein B [Vallitalea okinawensis]|uniref:AmmeMemoRadiSam system protein B n=1 Tax=Vallitalea okinawensis TaxID=2078660 RepID=UPI0013009408|nr:AmmeMemoRadiSam system protein B [Vallitalea okinawensis]
MNKRFWKFVRKLLCLAVISILLTKTVLVLEEEVITVSKPIFQIVDSKPFITHDNFYKTVSRQSSYETDSHLVGGILPHHDIASYMMADFYSSLAKVNEPEVIFIIGPNHYKRGERCQVGLFNFSTYSGTVSSDEEIIMELMQRPEIDQGAYEIFKDEHSINIHMNYIDYFFDDVTVVPIILKETFDQKDLVLIADKIKEVSKGKNVFYLASVDFSHYLTLEEANDNDQLTSQLLTELNTEQIITLDDDYMDCPSAITLLIKILEQNDPVCAIVDHNNSAVILKDPSMEETTSYFSVFFYTRN